VSLGTAMGELEAGLEALLSALGNAPAAELAASETAFARVSTAFEGVRAALEAAPDSRAEHETSLERCLRLYAVAVGLLAGRRDVLAAEREVCVQARGRLERLHAGPAAGASCDLSA